MRLTALVLCALLPHLLTAASGPLLVPYPTKLEPGQGVLVLGAGASIHVQGGGKRLAAAVERWTARWLALSGVKLAPAQGQAKAVISVNVTSKSPDLLALGEDESYELVVSAQNGVKLSAATEVGALRGLETLLQLVEKSGGKAALPALSIQDSPRFPWRGLLLDVCRHWLPLENVKRTLDGMALAKLNVLHWHLSEDQGFRVECKAYPKLHELGSDGNYYTHEQVREVIAYASERGIRVVPEFDMPGHVTAWLVGYPELGSAPGPYAIERKYGIFDPAFDPSREEVFTFLEKFLGEMAGLFPDAYMHLGGDENNGKHWNTNAAVQAFKFEKGFATNEDLQAYFTGRVGKILKGLGKRLVGWDEILHTELPEGTVVHSWRGTQAMVDSASRGFDTILSNGYYLDLGRPAYIHYANDPLPADSPIPATGRAHVLGGEGCMWAELVDPATLDARLWPRTLAVAERLWSPAEVKDVDDFYRREEAVSRQMELLGLRHLSYKQERLKAFAGSGKVEPLAQLADVLEPIEGYSRHRSRVYTSATPLDRLVDAVDVDSLAARKFKAQVDAMLASGLEVAGMKAVEASLKAWAGLDKGLAGRMAADPRTVEAAPLARDLPEFAKLGLSAMGRLRSGKLLRADWDKYSRDTAAHHLAPKGELELAIGPAVRKLTLAAAQVDFLKNTPAAQWEKSLEAQISSKDKW